MKGTATDDLTGVSSLGGKLIRFSGGTTTYWNGANWVAADPGYSALTITTSPVIPGAAGSPVNTTNWSITNEPATAAAWGTGTFTLLVNGTDGAGNTSADTGVTFYVDQAPPTVTITSPTQNQYFNATTVVSTLSTGPANLMKGTATDDLSGVASLGGKLIRFDLSGTTTYWNGANWVGADPGYGALTISTTPAVPGAAGSPVLSTNWTITNEPATAAAWGTGTFTLLVNGTDGAGNASADTSVVFYVDAVPPTVTITSPTQNQYFKATTVVSTLSTGPANLMKGTATDDLSGVASLGAKLIRLYVGEPRYA
jgi:hypothetical protein